MLSWELWKSINNPPLSHPVFEYGTRIKHRIEFDPVDNWYLIRLLNIMLIIGAVRIAISNPALVILLPIAAPLLVVLFIIAIPVLLPLAIFAYGAFLTMTISGSISEEKENNTYHLLCASPDGPLTINWLISNGILHRSHLFDWLYAAMRITTMLALVGLLIMVMIFSLMVIGMFSENSVQALPDAFRTIIQMIALLGIFYTGYVQSVVLSIVVGLLTPQYHANKLVAQPVAVMSYIALQLGTYMVAFFLAFSLSTMLSGYYMMLDFLLPILCFIIFFGLRELVIRWLWRHIVYRINAAPEDVCYLHVCA